MPPRQPLPYSAVRITPKQGDADCGIASLAMYLRRDIGEVLIAASRVRKTVWHDGLRGIDMVRVGGKLGVKLAWSKVFEIEHESGVLWITFNDSNKEHMVYLSEGRIIDPDHVPVHLWEDPQDFLTFWNGRVYSLLRKVDE